MSKVVDAFMAAFKRGLQSGAYKPNDIVRAVKAVDKGTDLLACLDGYCRRHDPARPPTKRETLELARITGFNLFLRAIEISDLTNGLAEMVQTLPVLDSRVPDAKLKSKHQVYAKRYAALDDKDRRELQDKAKRQIEGRIASRRNFLIESTTDEYRRKTSRASMSTAQLMTLLADAPEKRKAFEKVAAPCELAWSAASRASNKRPTTSAAVAALDAAFDAYAAYLRQDMRESADFLRLLVWLREATSDRAEIVQKGDATYRLSRRTHWANVWLELYLDAVARAQTLAVSVWNIGSVVQARGFTGPDAGFIYAPFNAREGQLMLDRLKKGFNNVPDFTAFHRARRRARIVGRLRGLDILDEKECDDLTDEIGREWRANPIEVAARKVTTTSQREAFRSTFHVNETVKNVFTVLWIPKGPNPRHAFIETHTLPGFFFKTDVQRVGLAEMLEDNAYDELRKNAQALTVFLLAYVQILGYALDVATAGASGGLRFIILRFAEERLKEQALSVGFEIAGIDNPWVQTLVGMGTNLVPSAIPRPKGLKIPHDLDVPGRLHSGVDRPPSGVPNSLERGTGRGSSGTGTPVVGVPLMSGPGASPAGRGISQGPSFSLDEVLTETGRLPARGGSSVTSFEHVRLMHGTEGTGFRGLGGLEEGRINVAHARGEDQDLGRGFYLTTDEATATAYGQKRNLQLNPKDPQGIPKGGGPTRVLVFDVPIEKLGITVDIRTGGSFRAQWEAFLNEPPFKLAGYTPPPAIATRRAYLASLGAEQRGEIFEDFLRSIRMQHADTIIGPLGDNVFTGITAGYETTQVCIRSQRVADRLNNMMRGTPRGTQ